MTARERHLARRAARPDRTLVRLSNGATFGGETLALCAGPCSVESEEQIEATAAAVARAGANVLRGGAFKPRTSPYAFQGLGRHGLALLRGAADRHGLAVVTEVLDPRDVAMVAEYADMLQIGARNMQNFALLREAGLAGKPILLKRGFAATVDEWLMAAEYVLVEGNPAGRSLRTRRALVRFGHAESARSVGGAAIGRADPPAGRRRSVARNRPGALGRAYEPSSDCSGRRRALS